MKKAELEKKLEEAVEIIHKWQILPNRNSKKSFAILRQISPFRKNTGFCFLRTSVKWNLSGMARPVKYAI